MLIDTEIKLCQQIHSFLFSCHLVCLFFSEVGPITPDIFQKNCWSEILQSVVLFLAQVSDATIAQPYSSQVLSVGFRILVLVLKLKLRVLVLVSKMSAFIVQYAYKIKAAWSFVKKTFLKLN